MSVTFNRAQLIRVTETALSEHDRAATAYNTDVERYKADHAAEFDIARLRRFRDWLTRHLNNGGPVSRPGYDIVGHNDLCSMFYSPPSDYVITKKVTRPQGLLSPSEIIEARALLQVLQAAEGDTVSVNELRLLGMKNLQPVFTAAAHENLARS